MARYIAIIALLLCVGCTTTKYVPIESVHTEYRDRVNVQRDSIYLRDSIYIESKGDTIKIERWRDRWRDRIIRDTINVQRTDTIQNIVEVEKPLTMMQKAKIAIGNIAIVAVFVFLLVYFVRRRFFNKQ